jgi:hypothetical protein
VAGTPPATLPVCFFEIVLLRTSHEGVPALRACVRRAGACDFNEHMCRVGLGKIVLRWKNLGMRVVGRRTHSPGDREGLTKLGLHFGGGAPKGIFRYATQEAANADWNQWVSERVQRRMKMYSE